MAGFRKPLRSGAGSRATSAWPRVAALPRAREPLLLPDGLPLSPSAWRPENPEGTAFHRSKASPAAPRALRQAYFSQLSLRRRQQQWVLPWPDPGLSETTTSRSGFMLPRKNAKPPSSRAQHCTFTKRLHAPSSDPQAALGGRGWCARQSSAPEPSSGLTAAACGPPGGPPASTGTIPPSQTPLPDAGRPRDLRKEHHTTRLHIPDADSTWAPFTFRGVRTTRGSITPVFFFCLFACIPGGLQKEPESPAGPQERSPSSTFPPPPHTRVHLFHQRRHVMAGAALTRVAEPAPSPTPSATPR